MLSEKALKKALLVILVVLSTVFAIYLVTYFNKIITIQDTKSIIPEEKPQADSFSCNDLSALNKTLVVSKFSNSAVDGKVTSNSLKLLKTNGRFTNGCLYVKASIDGKPIPENTSKKYAVTGGDVYMNVQLVGSAVNYGGHIIKDASLINTASDKDTEYLYNLVNIPYKDSYNDDVNSTKSSNWVALLNNNLNKKVISFLSTEKSGYIEEISIYYECENKVGCSVEVVE